MNKNKTLSMLALGDSYTIGEQVAVEQRFPEQTRMILQQEGIDLEPIKIIAVTGWTTDELIAGIGADKPEGTFNLVTLLIGVNNQYRGRDPENYRQEFRNLLALAVEFTGRKIANVFVLSIPDWGVTPFAADRDTKKIASEIDQYNAINQEESMNYGVHYIDITDISREALNDGSLLTADNLHPSGKMYVLWADRLAKAIRESQ